MIYKYFLIALLFTPSIVFSLDSSKSRSLQGMGLIASLIASIIVYFWSSGGKASKLVKILALVLVIAAASAAVLYAVAVNQFTSRT